MKNNISKIDEPDGKSDIQMKVKIRRQWNDTSKIAEVDLSKLRDIGWDSYSGGVQAPSPQPFLYGRIWCDEYQGDLAHSCAHGRPPHRIKVCITKTDNDPSIFAKLIAIAGPKPLRYKKRIQIS